MTEYLSGERVGLLVKRAGLALTLAGLAKVFVTLRSGRHTPSEKGGWIDLDPAADQREYIINHHSSQALSSPTTPRE